MLQQSKSLSKTSKKNMGLVWKVLPGRIKVKAGGLLVPTTSEFRFALFDEGAHAFGVVGRQAGFSLQFALEVELSLEIVVPRRVEGALDQGKAHCRRRCERGTKLLGFGQQCAVIDHF